jgi:hypothetical protein
MKQQLCFTTTEQLSRKRELLGLMSASSDPFSENQQGCKGSLKWFLVVFFSF